MNAFSFVPEVGPASGVIIVLETVVAVAVVVAPAVVHVV